MKPIIQDILQRSEELSLNEIVQVTTYEDLNKEIRWHPFGSIDNYHNDQITDTFLKDPYCKKTRWDLWNRCIELFKKHNIKTNLDIGCANNHFSFLCHINQIFSYGIDPRKYLIDLSNMLFQNAGITTKHAYIGNFSTLNKVLSNYKTYSDDNIFDCITVINFMHGLNHIEDEIINFLKISFNCSKYIFISRPTDQKSLVILDSLFKPLEIIESVPPHILYEKV